MATLNNIHPLSQGLVGCYIPPDFVDLSPYANHPQMGQTDLPDVTEAMSPYGMRPAWHFTAQAHAILIPGSASLDIGAGDGIQADCTVFVLASSTAWGEVLYWYGHNWQAAGPGVSLLGGNGTIGSWLFRNSAWQWSWSPSAMLGDGRVSMIGLRARSNPTRDGWGVFWDGLQHEVAIPCLAGSDPSTLRGIGVTASGSSLAGHVFGVWLWNRRLDPLLDLPGPETASFMADPFQMLIGEGPEPEAPSVPINVAVMA